MMSLLLAMSTAVTLAQTPNPNPHAWLKVHETGGVEVFAREVPGGRVREVMAVSVVPAPPERVIAVLLDVPHLPEYMPYMEECHIVEERDATTRYVYQRLNPPIVSRRDYTLRQVLTADPANHFYELQWDAVADKGPPPLPEVIRVTLSRGSWTLEPQEGGAATRLTYRLYTDPAGSLPAWAINKANTSSLPDLHLAVRRRSLDPGWRR